MPEKDILLLGSFLWALIGVCGRSKSFLSVPQDTHTHAGKGSPCRVGKQLDVGDTFSRPPTVTFVLASLSTEPPLLAVLLVVVRGDVNS